MSEVSLGHIDTCGTRRVCLHATLSGGHLGSFTHDTPAWQTPHRPTHSTAVALPVVGCLYGGCQAGVSCVKLPKCPPLRVTCRHTLWVPQVSIRPRLTSDIRLAVHTVC